jgi:hypothetical protein
VVNEGQIGLNRFLPENKNRKVRANKSVSGFSYDKNTVFVNYCEVCGW